MNNSEHNRKIDISVIIPLYNAASTIINTLESVRNQEYDGKIEIIVINDGST
ncbi:MAG: glycosyltransferase, partial [Bacteroidales bacterium]|nr:glycosyltransferase [Bacteroidales bacterium]